jgi:rhodanese-related sulfurtransferase
MSMSRRLATREIGQRRLARQAKPRYISRMKHSPAFLELVEDAKSRVQEISIDAARERLAANPDVVLLDVREESEWTQSHAKDAQYLGKGVLERDLESRFPDKETEIIMYCGGGYRSALTCDAAQKMGYTNVSSLENGYRGLIAADWAMESG